MQEELKVLSESVKGITKPRHFPEVPKYWRADVRPIGGDDFISSGYSKSNNGVSSFQWYAVSAF